MKYIRAFRDDASYESKVNEMNNLRTFIAMAVNSGIRLLKRKYKKTAPVPPIENDQDSEIVSLLYQINDTYDGLDSSNPLYNEIKDYSNEELINKINN